MANSYQNEVDAPEMASVASLAENLVYRLPGCSDVMVRKTIQAVYRDFCRRSCALHEETVVGLAPMQGRIAAASRCGIRVDAVAGVEMDGRRLLENRDYRVEVGSGAVVVLDIHLVTKETGHFVKVTTVSVPPIGTEDSPAWFVERFGDAICSGVCARLMSMTNKPWSDAAQAGVENVAYENAVGAERVKYCEGDSGKVDSCVDKSEIF